MALQMWFWLKREKNLYKASKQGNVLLEVLVGELPTYIMNLFNSGIYLHNY